MKVSDSFSRDDSESVEEVFIHFVSAHCNREEVNIYGSSVPSVDMEMNEPMGVPMSLGPNLRTKSSKANLLCCNLSSIEKQDGRRKNDEVSQHLANRAVSWQEDGNNKNSRLRMTAV